MNIREDINTQLDRLEDSDLIALYLVLVERVGQISREGITPDRDDTHGPDGNLAAAAAAYAKIASDELRGIESRCPSWWPWGKAWWKPYGFQRNLERSGALVLAEISRLIRVS